MTLCDLLDKVKKEIDFTRVGMFACHNGVVRGTTRDGEAVSRLIISCDINKWNEILNEMRRRPGISAVEAYLHEGERNIGDDILLIVVAGDIREHVLPVLEETLERLKREAIKKKEERREQSE
ncbi:MAG: molybdenum cofactor biosynthesis protein MoaE [Syntrophobacterales bacterium]|nr:molybdenum cofactor biosynthesis protein MoaE [Syntrophobacterales bacterium]